MKKVLPILALLTLACAPNLRQQAIEYAYSTWETLDTAFYSWVIVQPDIMEFHLNNNRRAEAEKVYARMDWAVKQWMPIKKEVEALITQGALEEYDSFDTIRLSELLEHAEEILYKIGALTRKR